MNECMYVFKYRRTYKHVSWRFKVFQQFKFARAFKVENNITFTLNIQSSGFTTRCRSISWRTFASVISLEIDTFSSVGAAKETGIVAFVDVYQARDAKISRVNSKSCPVYYWKQ